MPFSLANSSSVSQGHARHMGNRVHRRYPDSNSLEEHIHHVRSVLKHLLQYELCAKAEKCEFHQTSTSFFWYIISQEGVARDEKKVKAVLEWPQPQTVKELQSFLGFANYR